MCKVINIDLIGNYILYFITSFPLISFLVMWDKNIDFHTGLAHTGHTLSHKAGTHTGHTLSHRAGTHTGHTLSHRAGTHAGQHFHTEPAHTQGTHFHTGLTHTQSTHFHTGLEMSLNRMLFQTSSCFVSFLVFVLESVTLFLKAEVVKAFNF